MASYKICNFKILVEGSLNTILIDAIKHKLESYKPDTKVISYFNYDNKSYLSICYVKDSYLGIFLVKDKKLITEQTFNNKEANLFLKRLDLFANALLANEINLTAPAEVAASWLEALSYDLDSSRIAVTMGYLNKVFNSRVMDIDKFKSKVDSLANSVPIATIEEFYGTQDVRTELKVYLALCYSKEVEPIREDKNYFRGI